MSCQIVQIFSEEKTLAYFAHPPGTQPVLSGRAKNGEIRRLVGRPMVVRCAGPPCKEVRWLPLTCAICTTGPWGTFVRRKGEGQWQRTIDPPSPLSMRVHTVILIHTMCGAHGQLETCHPCQCVLTIILIHTWTNWHLSMTSCHQRNHHSRKGCSQI